MTARQLVLSWLGDELFQVELRLAKSHTLLDREVFQEAIEMLQYLQELVQRPQ